METDFPSFLGLDPEYTKWDRAKFTVVPCPYERTTSYLKGTESGPVAILEASHQVEYFDSELKSQPCDQGIYTFAPLKYDELSEQEALLETEKTCKKSFDAQKFPIVLGGEHTISVAPIRAAWEACDKKLSVLHFDAHSDMRDTYEGNKFSHASIIRRVHEFVEKTYSVGIRAQCQEEAHYLEQNKTKYGILYDHERAQSGLIVEKALEFLTEPNLYITIDLDYFCPQEMPSVGTPVPGGGHWYETLHFLRKIFEARNVVGADVVELRPDGQKRSDFFAAQLVYKLISYKATART